MPKWLADGVFRTVKFHTQHFEGKVKFTTSHSRSTQDGECNNQRYNGRQCNRDNIEWEQVNVKNNNNKFIIYLAPKLFADYVLELVKFHSHQ